MGKEKMRHTETARRLQIAMSDANITQQELAERAKISKASISQYANGWVVPSNISAGAMAEILNVSPVWLMGFDVPKEAEKKHDSDMDKIAMVMQDPDLRKQLMGFVNYLLSTKGK